MITRFFQYIIKSDNVIIPEIKESNKRRWPMVLALVLLLISAAAIIATLLYQLKHKGLYINDFIIFLFILHYNLKKIIAWTQFLISALGVINQCILKNTMHLHCINLVFFAIMLWWNCIFFYCCSQEIDKIPYPDPEMQAPTTQSPISGQNVTIGKHVI